MACFIVPAAEAIITTIVTKAVKAKEGEANQPEAAQNEAVVTDVKIPFSRKLKWLTNMLWGGSILLAFEHLWHGEVIPTFPFLSAAANPADASAMLHEMATVGVGMAAAVTAVWGVMLLVAHVVEKRALNASDAQAA